MPNQTLYDNFSQVRQYIDQEKPDLSSYITKSELSNCSYVTTSELSSYLPLTGGTLSGNLFAGDQEKTTVTFLATRRKCGDTTSYMASFFTNSDGRSKFAHKSYTGTKPDVSSDVDDAFMCFNAYGFRVACSGEQGVAASTEYDVLHTGNIGNLGYVTTTQLNTVNSTGKIHYGTAVHDRTTYTTTCTVDTFDTDSNGNPLAGTTICVKLTSITGTNPATLYTVKFIVNGKENPRYYDKAVVSGTGRNWYRDMSDSKNGFWYWTFDGTNWVWMGISREVDTTYSAMTDAEASAGTSTSARLIKPVTLATYYTPKSAFVYDSTTYTLTITV